MTVDPVGIDFTIGDYNYFLAYETNTATSIAATTNPNPNPINSDIFSPAYR